MKQKKNILQMVVVLALVFAMLFGQSLEAASAWLSGKNIEQGNVAVQNPQADPATNIEDETPPNDPIGFDKATPTPNGHGVLPIEPTEAVTTPEVPQPTPTEPGFSQWTPAPIFLSGDFVWVPVVISGVTVGARITAYTGTATDIVIPNTVVDSNGSSLNVTEIGDHALQDKHLSFVVLPDHLEVIGQYAFSGNKLTSTTVRPMILPNTLADIQKYAFRDNDLTVLSLAGLGNHLIQLGNAAFMNNKLSTLTIGEGLQVLGDSVFEGNDLTELSMPNSIAQMGVRTFAQNGRYVKLVTSNPIIHTEYVENGFGHVVNPITIIIRSVDLNGNMLISDIVLGADLSIAGEVFSANVPVTYTPRAIVNFWAGLQNFTPTGDGYLHTVVYRPTNVPPVIIKDNFTIPLNSNPETVRSLVVLGLSASDLSGADITPSVTYNEAYVASIDTAIPGEHSIVYSVTDRWGNTSNKTVTAMVGGDWNLFPIGNGWLLGDFSYSGDIVTGFSANGLTKFNGGNHSVVMPHVNPNEIGPDNLPTTAIKAIADNAFSTYVIQSLSFQRVTELESIGESAFRSSILSSVDFSANKKLISIGSESFYSSSLTGFLNFGSLPALRFIRSNAFYTANPASLDFTGLTALEEIGEAAFYSTSNPQSLDFSHCPSLQVIDTQAFANITSLQSLVFDGNNALTKIGDEAFNQTVNLKQLSLLGAPNLSYIGAKAFERAGLTTLVFGPKPALLMIGERAFGMAKPDAIDLSGCTALTHIGDGAFTSATTGNLSFPSNSAINYIGADSFRNSQIAEFRTQNLPNLEYIGSYAFQNAGAVNLTGSPNLRFIGTAAFQGAKGSSIDLSNNTELRYIGDMSFVGMRLSSLDLSANTKLQYLGAAFAFSPITNLNLGEKPELLVIADYAFVLANLSFLNLNTAPKLQMIGDNAFSASNLTTLNLQGAVSLQKIGVSAFAAARITALDLSANTALTVIDSNAFANAPLTSLRFGNHPNLSVLSIKAFKSAQLTSLDLSGLSGLGYIGEGCFNDSPLTVIQWPQSCSLSVIENSAFLSAHLTELDLSACSQLGILGYRAFTNSNLTEIWISSTANVIIEETPTTSLGPSNSSELYNGLLALSGGYKAAVLRTHNPAEAATANNPTGEGTVPLYARSYREYNLAGLDIPESGIGEYHYREASATFPWSTEQQTVFTP